MLIQQNIIITLILFCSFEITTMHRYVNSKISGSKLSQKVQTYLPKNWTSVGSDTTQAPTTPQATLTPEALHEFLQEQASTAQQKTHQLFQHHASDFINTTKMNPQFTPKSTQSTSQYITDDYEQLMYYQNMLKLSKDIERFLAKSPETVRNFYRQQQEKHAPIFNKMFQCDAKLKKLFHTKYFQIFTTIYMYIGIIFFIYVFYQHLTESEDPLSEELSTVISLIQDAFDLHHIRFSALKDSATAIVSYDVRTKKIILNPQFFTLPKKDQALALIHETRHALQYAGRAELSADIIEYAKACSLNLGWGLYKFLNNGSYWSPALREFDAEYFTYSYIPTENSIQAKTWSKHRFNPNIGYFSEEIVQGLLKSPKINAEWVKFINDPKTKDAYLTYIPHELKQQATENAYNRVKRQRKEQYERKKRMDDLFSSYLYGQE